MIVMKDTALNIGTSSVLALAANPARKALVIQNKHATQTLRAKFGSDVVSTDVVQVQKIAFGTVPDAGTFKITWNSLQSAAIANTAVAADVQTALRAVTGLGSVTVSGDFTVGFSVTMTGVTPNVAANFPLLIVSQNSLTTSSVAVVVTVTITTAGQYADGVVVLAANGSLSFIGDACPLDAVYLLASGANTRAELMEG